MLFDTVAQARNAERALEAAGFPDPDVNTLDRKATLLTDVDWSDKLIEVVESDKEAVVSKTARVAEEVRVRKGESARTETVRDTAPKQQVDVERVATERTQAERTQAERRTK